MLGIGQIYDEMGNPTDMNSGGFLDILGPSTGQTIINTTPGSSPSGPGFSNILAASIPGLLNLGATIAKNVTAPVAQIAGPYGISQIPYTQGGGTYATPSALGGAISPTILLLGVGALALMMMKGH